jgi:hypothetical protein
MTITEWICSANGITTLIIVLAWLLQLWISYRLKNSIQHEYDLKIEKHRADLKRDYDVQLANMNAEFAKNQFRFSHIHKHTADAVVEIYRMMVKLKEGVHAELSLVGKTFEQAIEKRQEFDKKRKEFYNYFIENKIYLPRKTAEKINHFSERLIVIPLQYEAALTGIKDEASYQKLMGVVDGLFNEVPKLLESLEDDFQNILGIDDIKASTTPLPHS